MNECPQHSHLETKLESIDEKLDLIIERQLEYSNRITKLETLVTNGLSHNVIEIRAKMDIICEEFGKRLTELESFGWFRKSVSKLRDNLFIYFIQLSIVGGVVYVLIHFGKDVLDKVLK